MSKPPTSQRGNKPPSRAPAAPAEPVQAQQVTIHQQTHYSGDIPPPGLLRQFDELLPGTAARLIGWAETEAEHRRAMEKAALDGNLAAQAAQMEIARYDSKASYRGGILGQLCGLAVCVLCVAGAVWCALHGHTAVALALAAIPTAAVIRSFGIKLPPSK
jgi:uncharacterized membrane protein